MIEEKIIVESLSKDQLIVLPGFYQPALSDLTNINNSFSHAMVLLGDIACSIAAYELGFHSVREQIETNYSGALHTLRQPSEGTIRLPCDEYKYGILIDPPGFKHYGAS